MLMAAERELVAEYGRKLSAAGLCPGTSGNISIFEPGSGLMAISPSGMDYFATRAEDVVVLDTEGRSVDSTRRPSSEWGLHAAFYRAKPEVRAVVHTHSVYCTTFAVLGEPIRAVHYAMADAGVNAVPCAPYCTFGTPELAEAAVETCGEGRAVLLSNHGLVALGGDIGAAFSLAVNLEYTAELQYRALCIGSPRVLSDGQMAAVRRRFASYGQPGGKKGGY